jgi:hypothetical protein
MLAVVGVIGVAICFGNTGGDDNNAPDALTSDPFNATFIIEGTRICLLNGHFEREAALGSGMEIKTSVFGKPAYGDIDGDGCEDAAMVIVHDPGGSGTFFYVAAALKVDGAYHGTNGVLLGDRISPQDIKIRNGVVVANYTDRRPEESMAITPSIGKSKYLTINNGLLSEIAPISKGAHLFEGWVTVGHEVRSFAPCSHKVELWVLGGSPALKDIVAAYQKELPGPRPYPPLFMTLAGKMKEPPTEGFGAEYDGAFFAMQCIRVFPRGNCKSELIYLDSPLPGALISSPLKLMGSARGTWFFEGDFPLLLKDSKGRLIAKGFATAKGDWMTKEFVRFEGTLDFKQPGSGKKGTLILKKDNPTGLLEHDDALEAPVFFK